jgi:SAM-dependent methyltransferase
MVEAARRTVAASGKSVELGTASIYELPFADGVFDAVRAERVFQHLDNPEGGLREMLRVTKPGGRVLASDPDHGQAGLALDDPVHRRVYEALQRAMTRMIVNPHSGTRLRGMFVRAGLGDVAQLVNSFAFDHPQFMQMFFVSERLAAAMGAGEITAQEGADFVATLAERHRAGTFFSSAVGYTVAGTKLHFVAAAR